MKSLPLGRIKVAFYIVGALLASLFLYTLIAQAAFVAAVNVVDSTDDLIADDGNCTLREAVEAFNTDTEIDACASNTGDSNTIEFDPSINGLTITLSSELEITESMEINGNGQGVTIIDGADSTRLFHILASGKDVTLADMTLQNGSVNEGGAVKVEYADSVLISNVEFDSNEGDVGAVFYVEDGTFEILDSIFTNNTATSDAGVLYTDTSDLVEINNSTFTGNSAPSGGVIYASYGLVMEINGSTFTDNSSVYGGGAINTYVDDTTIDGSTFDGNTTSNSDGGAIYLQSGDAMTILNSTFTDNSVTANDKDGGAIFNRDGGDLIVARTDFTGNSANNSGGAISAINGVVDVEDSTFTSNSSLSGGAIAIEFDTELTIDGSTFTSNTSDDDAGGAIYSNGLTGVVNIYDTAFTSNVAGWGGAIYVDGEMGIYYSSFDSNVASNVDYGEGGAIYHQDGALDIVDTSFTNNSATTDAGAVYLYSNFPSLNGVTFSGNTAVEEGGAIFSDADTDIEIVDSTFSNNSAAYGGALYTFTIDTITNSTFNGNTASADGGAVYTVSNMDVTNSTFSGNSATNEGGAVYGEFNFWGGTSYFTHVTMTGNSASDGADVFALLSDGSPVFAASILNSGNSCGGEAITSDDYNVENGDTCGLGEANDLVNTDSELLSLANNGGVTMTHDLLSDTVLNSIPDGVACTLAEDQVGTSRPQEGACEPGAFEHVNLAPVAVADSASTAVDVAVIIDVLANDTDIDGTIVPSTLDTGPISNGVLSSDAVTGEVTYTPNVGFTGEDSFTYDITDEDGATSNIVTVTITVGSNGGGHNASPVANDDSASTEFETAVLIDVLANDTDSNGSVDATTVAITSEASNGTLSVDATTGEITYTPDAGFDGADSFTYIMRDNENTNSNIATVSVTVAPEGVVVIAEEPGTGTGGEVVLAGDCDFADIAGHRYEDAIVALCGAGIIEGYRDEAGELTGVVGVDDMLNRAESQTIITRSVFGEPAAGNYKSCFPDVNEEWFASYVCYAKEFLGLTGYLGGENVGYMLPADTVSFEELTKMLITSNEVDLAVDIADDEWYQVYLDTAEELGALEGLSLSVGQDLTRGQSFQLMYNVLVAIGTL